MWLVVVDFSDQCVSSLTLICQQPSNTRWWPGYEDNIIRVNKEKGVCSVSLFLSLSLSPLTDVPCRLHRRQSSWMGRSCMLCCGGCLLWPTGTWRSTSWSPSCTWPSGSCVPSLGLCRGHRCCVSGTCSFVRVRYCTDVFFCIANEMALQQKRFPQTNQVILTEITSGMNYNVVQWMDDRAAECTLSKHSLCLRQVNPVVL